MCVTCKIPLNVAESPQANRERAYIQGLIDEGKDEAQIKRALVSPVRLDGARAAADHGFDLAAYLVPLAAVLVLLACSPSCCHAGGGARAATGRSSALRCARRTRRGSTRTSRASTEGRRDRHALRRVAYMSVRRAHTEQIQARATSCCIDATRQRDPERLDRGPGSAPTPGSRR